MRVTRILDSSGLKEAVGCYVHAGSLKAGTKPFFTGGSMGSKHTGATA